MIAIPDIYTALRETVEAACAAADLIAPVMASDLAEPVVRPSFKIILSEHHAERETAYLVSRRLSVTLVYYPPEVQRWREAHFAAQAALMPWFWDALWVGAFEIPIAEPLEFEQVDGILVGAMVLDWMEVLPSANDMPGGAWMEELDLSTGGFSHGDETADSGDVFTAGDEPDRPQPARRGDSDCP